MNALKETIKQNQFYKKLKFWKNIRPADVFRLKKLALLNTVQPFTMSSYQRVNNVYTLARDVENKKMEGVFAECGVWKGGIAAVMAKVADEAKSGRKTWLFDSFEGLPEPGKEDGELAKTYSGNRMEGKMTSIDKCVGPIEDVQKIFFDILKLKNRNVAIRKGWFQDTLPKAKKEIGKISILRLDGDWYESTKVCLDNLYDNVVSGGYIIIDDYGHWEGAKKALEEFFTERSIKSELKKIDYTGVYFQKM